MKREAQLKRHTFWVDDGDNGTGWYWRSDWKHSSEQQKYGPYPYRDAAYKAWWDARDADGGTLQF